MAIAAAVVAAYVHFGYAWWTLAAMFLVFDISALGYLSGPRTGAFWYNAVHNYTAPAILGLAYLVTARVAEPVWVLGFFAGTWAFHIAVDRALGYGLKLTTGFQHTHLGRIGPRNSRSNVPARRSTRRLGSAHDSFQDHPGTSGRNPRTRGLLDE